MVLRRRWGIICKKSVRERASERMAIPPFSLRPSGLNLEIACNCPIFGAAAATTAAVVVVVYSYFRHLSAPGRLAPFLPPSSRFS